MTDIFISYAREDRERVRPLAANLEQCGYSVWWDERIRAGEEFDQTIDRAIAEAGAVVVAWSKDSVESRWVKEEADDGLQRGCLLPVLIDDVTIPRGFRRLQAGNFTDGDFTNANPDWLNLCWQIDNLLGRARGPGHQEPPHQEPPRQEPQPPSADARARGLGWAGSRRAALAAVPLLLLLCVGFGWLVLRGDGAPPPPSDMTPTIIGIYPNDSFGPQQKRGLHLALETVAPGTGLIDLQASTDEMKLRGAPGIIEALAKALRERNVIAIVGPSVTEFVPEVLRTIEESGREPAVLLTTAGPRATVGWDKSDLPIFRIGSGVDQRSAQLAALAKRAVARGMNIVFLVEHTPNNTGTSYGELFFQSISQFLPDWQQWVATGRVSHVSYERGRAVESLRELKKDDIFDEANLVLMLGLGGDYLDLAKAYFRAEDPPRRAIMGSWLSAFAVDAPFRETPMQVDRLFEMTDVSRMSPNVDDLTARSFRREFGDLTPAHRDEAITFDCGVVISLAMQGIEGTVTAKDLVERIRGTRFRGVSGDILFGSDGQNSGTAGGVGRPLSLVRFDKDANRWTAVPSPDQLLSTIRRRAAVAR